MDHCVQLVLIGMLLTPQINSIKIRAAIDAVQIVYKDGFKCSEKGK